MKNNISDKTLINISIIIIMIGLTGTAYIINKLPPITYNKFLKADEGSLIKIQGTIISNKQIKNISILTLSSDCKISAISFTPINASGKVNIIGKKETYNGEPEIIIDSIATPIN